MSISSDIRQKEKAVEKLQTCRKDLMDDTSAITQLNREVGDLQADFQKFIVADNTHSVVDKIGEYLEPYQSSDYNLQTADDYMEKEIAALEREIAALERALEAARAAKAALSGN